MNLARTILLVFVYLCYSSTAYGLQITEIMANPLADESLNEWVELYNNDSVEIDVVGFVIGDDKDLDEIEGGLYGKKGTMIPGYGFAIVTDDRTRVYNNFNISGDVVKLYVDDGSIGNGLSNSGESIYLFDKGGILLHNVSYEKTEKGKSWHLVNGSFVLGEPTPGYDLLNNKTTKGANETTTEKNNGNICDYRAKLVLNTTTFNVSEDILFRFQILNVFGSSTSVTGRISIYDLYGKAVKTYKPFTNASISKQRTSRLYKPSLGPGVYVVKGGIEVACLDRDEANNDAVSYLVVVDEPLPVGSSLEITKIYDLGTDKLVNPGQTIRARIEGYRGLTSKEVVAVWIEDKSGKKYSKQSKANILEKQSKFSIVVPIALNKFCKGIATNDYFVKASGLDSDFSVVLPVNKDYKCSKTEKATAKNGNKKTKKRKFSYSMYSYPEILTMPERLAVAVLLDNDGDDAMDIALWSYVYRGSKSYSGERELNKQTIVLKSHSAQLVDLENKLEGVAAGNYSYKVLINKNNQKTNYELKRGLEIREVGGKERKNKEESKEKDDKEIEIKPSSSVIFESTTESSRKTLPYLILAAFSVLSMCLVFSK